MIDLERIHNIKLLKFNILLLVMLMSLSFFKVRLQLPIFPRNLTAARNYFEAPFDAVKCAVPFQGQQDFKEMRYLSISYIFAMQINSCTTLIFLMQGSLHLCSCWFSGGSQT